MNVYMAFLAGCLITAVGYEWVTRTKIGTRRRVKDPELVDRVIAAAIGRAA